MMSDIEILYDFYKKHFSSTIDTFENCSLDMENGVNLSHSQTKCFNFDKIKNIVFSGADSCCSVDSLYFDINNNVLYFIEFKNSKIKTSKGNVIRSCRESYIINRFISTFSGIVDIHNINFCSLLVASESKNSNTFQTLRLIDRAGSGDLPTSVALIETNLRNVSYLNESLFFSDVKIFSESQFDSAF